MKSSNLKFGAMLVAASLVFGTVSCRKGCTDPQAINYDSKAKKDDGSCQQPSTNTGVEVKAGFISADETWTADKIYKIVGKVVVQDGVTLTIQPGTIIKAQQGTGTLASALVVAQGGKINACGTATQPIIFTSELDNITTGQLSGTNLSETDQGLWGGILVLGRAPISAGDGDDLSQIEGIPSSDTFGAFGGSDAADNSGTMCYVSIRHGGALIGANNEINGLTLGGVGSGTSISNIEVVANLDDGVEFFGGTVNVSNVFVAHCGDDAIDIDMNYSGTVTNFVVVNGTNSDKVLEIDGPEGTTHVNGLFTLQDGTTYAYATGGNPATADYKSKAQGTSNNVKMGEVKIRSSFESDCTTPKTDAYTYLTQASPKLVFTASEFTAPNVYTKSDDGATPPTVCTVPTGYQGDASTAMGASTAASGATTTFVNGWAWAAINNKM